MMPRNSASRYNRRGSPTRRNRPRSISPMFRSTDSAMNVRGRKHLSSWKEQPSNLKGLRSRSRSRDKILRGDADKPFRGSSWKARDRFEDRRPKESFRMDHSKDKKGSYKRDAQDFSIPNRAGEGNYMDSTRSANNFREINNEVLLDPSSVSFDPYYQDDDQLEPPHPPSIEPYVRQSEIPDERIKRLEKLVEKLVDGNAKAQAQEKSYSRNSSGFPELIPSNCQFTTSMWLNKVHEECIKRGFDEKTTIQFTQDKMSGIMKAWFKSVSTYAFTWPELKLLITKTFPDNVDFAATLKLLVARDKTSEETITQYYFSKLYLCEACKITGENAVSCLIDGLSNPFMKQDIKSHKFLSPEALYSEYLYKFPDSEIPVKLDREVIPSYNDDFVEYNNPDRHAPIVKKKGEKVRCTTCHKFGHLAVQCRHAPICYNCQKEGHIAAKCYAKPVMLISTENELPQWDCKINGRLYKGILDTGSGAVIIRKKVMDDLKLICKPSKISLKAFGGNFVDILGTVKINIDVENVKRSVNAIVVDDHVQDYAIIIGQAYFQQNVGSLAYNNEMKVFDLNTL